MKTWSESLRDALVSGVAASALSTVVLGLLGARESRSPVGPINAISHWYWGDAAAQADDVDAKHTLAGFLTHTVAAIFWAVLFERFFGARAAQSRQAALIGGGITAALAATIDYTVTPKRLTPGYEMRLKPASLIFVYAAVALGLALTRRPTASGENVAS
jgi:hypothetical protein